MNWVMQWKNPLNTRFVDDRLIYHHSRLQTVKLSYTERSAITMSTALMLLLIHGAMNRTFSSVGDSSGECASSLSPDIVSGLGLEHGDPGEPRTPRCQDPSSPTQVQASSRFTRNTTSLAETPRLDVHAHLSPGIGFTLRNVPISCWSHVLEQNPDLKQQILSLCKHDVMLAEATESPV